MNFGIREWRQFERMRPDQRARSIESKAVVLLLIISLLLLGGGTFQTPKVCTHGVFLWPMIAIGLFLMVIFVLGFCAVRERDDCLYGCYFIGLLIVILALLGFVIFGYVAVGGIDIGAVRVREYNLKDYSGWLRGRVADPRYWATTNRCLHDKNVCNGMTQLVRDPDTGIYVPELSPFEKWAKEHRFMEEYVHVMSPIESGCCKPPSSCGFTYENGTTWTPTPGAPAVETDGDCSRWSNDQETLCFQCDTCKAGFLDDTKKAWSIAAFFPVFALIGAILSCWSGCEYA